MPARAAASTLSLMPPTGSTRPRSEISPVIATCRRARRPDSAETSAVASATPAEGPSFGTAPAGTWRWISPAREQRCWTGRAASAFARTQDSAASARLAHHVAELAGEPQAHAFAAGHRGGLDEQDVAAVVRAREARRRRPARWCARRSRADAAARRAPRSTNAGVDRRSGASRGLCSATRRAALRIERRDAADRDCGRRPRACTRAPPRRSRRRVKRTLLRPSARAPRAASAPGGRARSRSLSRSV